jgi:hypothetical protein
MSRRQIFIDFNVPDDPRRVAEQGLIHRILNFQEDLYRLLPNDHAVVENLDRVDRTRPRVWVTLTSNRHTGSVLITIEKQLAYHNLAQIASISKS